MIDLDSLPNPYLANYLPASYPGLDADTQRVALRDAHLRAAHLPADYDDLAAVGQYKARVATLQSWYDVNRPNVFCSRVDNLIAALYLWVEEYVKPARHNRGVYYNRDPRHKYQMVRDAFSPPRDPTQPAKTLIVAARGSTKTITLVRQLLPMAACCRPYTFILFSEINEDRTVEELQAIRTEIEQNEFIERDFGGKGELYPKSSRGSAKWNDSTLGFLHLPGNRIIGSSFYAKHRGRHPVLRVIDDPEDDQVVAQTDHRGMFTRLLFSRDMGMMGRGGVYLWIQTRVLRGVCDYAMQHADGTFDEVDPEIQREMADARWDDWNITNHDLLVEGADGKLESIYPDHITAEGFESTKRSLGLQAAMAEYRGQRVAQGELALPRDTYRHGYMHCVEKATNEHYLLDLKTGHREPWEPFLESLFTVAACDIADSTRPGADFGAVAVVGITERGVMYVLDMVIRRMIAPMLIRTAYTLAIQWHARKLGWERAGLQAAVMRMAPDLANELKNDGHRVPTLESLTCGATSKVARILTTLRPPINNERIRFPHFEPMVDAEGAAHLPARHASAQYFRFLYDQIDSFTDEGPSGHDDGIDALHMAVRLLCGRKGKVAEEQDPTEAEVQAWADAGVEVRFDRLPPECRPTLWWQEHRAELVEVDAGVDDYVENDPYD